MKGKTGLLVAAAEGWPEVVKLLLQFKANVDQPVTTIYCTSCTSVDLILYFVYVAELYGVCYRMRKETLLFTTVPICKSSKHITSQL